MKIDDLLPRQFEVKEYGVRSGEISLTCFDFHRFFAQTQPVKLDLNKKLGPKQKTIQAFNIDAQGFRKTRNENPLTWEIGVTS